MTRTSTSTKKSLALEIFRGYDANFPQVPRMENPLLLTPYSLLLAAYCIKLLDSTERHFSVVDVKS